MKKNIFTISALALCISFFAACDNSNNDPAEDNGHNNKETVEPVGHPSQSTETLQDTTKNSELPNNNGKKDGGAGNNSTTTTTTTTTKPSGSGSGSTNTGSSNLNSGTGTGTTSGAATNVPSPNSGRTAKSLGKPVRKGGAAMDTTKAGN
jgi:hypothetical protein